MTNEIEKFKSGREYGCYSTGTNASYSFVVVDIIRRGDAADSIVIKPVDAADDSPAYSVTVEVVKGVETAKPYYNCYTRIDAVRYARPMYS